MSKDKHSTREILKLHIFKNYYQQQQKVTINNKSKFEQRLNYI